MTPRVSSVCKLVPRFLRVYFDVLLNNAPPECIERVVPLLLQRFASLYPVDFFLNSVHTLIIDTLQAIFSNGRLSHVPEARGGSCHFHPLGCARAAVWCSISCWIIGELLRPPLYENGGRAGVAMFFEALETLAYQAISITAAEPEEEKKELKVEKPGAGERPGPGRRGYRRGLRSTRGRQGGVCRRGYFLTTIRCRHHCLADEARDKVS